MTNPAILALDQAIAALTVDHIEQHFDGGIVREGEAVPLLDRSIGRDLIRIDAALSGQGQTLLSATAHAIDEALLAIEQARQTLREARPALNLIGLPVLGKLVDRPRGGIRLSALRGPAAPEETNKMAGSGAMVARPVEGSGALGQKSASVTSPVRAGSSPAPANSSSFAPAERPRPPVRRAEAIRRQRVSTSLDTNGGEEARADRLAQIREAARAIQRKQDAAPDARPDARPVFGVRQAKARPLPVNPVELRQREFAAASAWLQSRGVLVSVVERDAAIRKYRVSGKAESRLADEVVQIARDLGWTTDVEPKGL